MCTHSSVALLPMAHQGRFREGSQANHLFSDGSECYPLPCRHFYLDLPMLVSWNLYLSSGRDSDNV
jgi:hypothetical protein